ncbi:OprD family outer membrane porin [Endozoicomonas atrinae]|uniref:OprD family outer membrane porin n=1 Tax=Endozoicomonas atrinae TaxID=1333660 RepID=UPI00082508B4|nr:OprD family outer membrane porin [Endozoicomonas atrinae]
MVGSKKLGVGFELSGLGVFEIAERNSNDIYGDGYVTRDGCYPDPSNRGRLTCPGRSGFSKISQASMMVKYGTHKKRSVTGRFGMGYLEGGAISSYDKDDGFLPRSYTGMSLNGVWNDLEYSGAFVNGVMSDYETSIQPLTIFLSRPTPGTPKVTLDYVASINAILKRGRTFYQLDYARAAIGLNRYGGSKWDEAVTKGVRKEEEDNASLASLRMLYKYDNFSLALAHSVVGGDRSYEKYMGDASLKYTQYAKGFADSFLSEKTKSYQLKTQYKFSSFDVPVLRDMTLIYSYSHANKEHEIDDLDVVGTAKEHAIEFKYVQPSGYFGGGFITAGIGKLKGDDSWVRIANDEPENKGDVTKFEIEVQFPIY